MEENWLSAKIKIAKKKQGIIALFIIVLYFMEKACCMRISCLLFLLFSQSFFVRILEVFFLSFFLFFLSKTYGFKIGERERLRPLPFGDPKKQPQ